MNKTAHAPRVRALNLYTVESNGQPVAQAMAISQAEAVRLYVKSVQQPTMSARLSTPMEARTLAGLPLLQREPAAVDTKTADLFGDVPSDRVSPAIDAAWAAAEVVDAEWVPIELGNNEATPATDHVEDSRAMVEPLAAGGFSPCGRALGDCGKATQTCGRDGCGVELAPIAAGLPAEFLSYIEGEEVAAAQPGEPAGCLDAAPTAGELAGVSSAVDDDGGLELTAAEQLVYEAQGAARFAQHHGGELKRQAEAAAARAGGKIVAKFRDPATGQTWSGRGLQPRWLAQGIEAGKMLNDFLIDTQGAQA